MRFWILWYIFTSIIFSVFLEIISIVCAKRFSFSENYKDAVLRLIFTSLMFPFAVPMVIIDAFLHVVKRRIYHYEKLSMASIARKTYEKRS